MRSQKVKRRPSKKPKPPRRPSTTERVLSTVNVLIGCHDKDAEAVKTAKQDWFPYDIDNLRKWVAGLAEYRESRKYLNIHQKRVRSANALRA